MEQEDIIKSTEQLYGSSFLQNSIRDYLANNQLDFNYGDYEIFFGNSPEIRIVDFEVKKPTTLKNGLPNNWDDEKL